MNLSLDEYSYKKKPSVYAIESSDSENEEKQTKAAEGVVLINIIISPEQ